MAAPSLWYERPGCKSLAGRTFGRLTVMRPDDRPHHWACECSCGGGKVVKGTNLANGHTRSCGCLRRETCKALLTIHGGKGTAEYGVWKAMKGRCLRRNHHRWKYYGGRGIAVCNRWLNDFPAFLADMGPRPSPRHRIERLDNDGHYEPGNCVWATQTVQCNNRSSNVRIEFDGRTMTIAEWARERDIRAGTLWHRLKHRWGLERALGYPAS